MDPKMVRGKEKNRKKKEKKVNSWQRATLQHQRRSGAAEEQEYHVGP